MVLQESECRRILYVQNPIGGGSALSLYDLVRGLDRQRFEPIMLFLQENDYCRQFEQLGIRIITLPKSESLGTDAKTDEDAVQQRPKGFMAKLRDFVANDVQRIRQITSIIEKEHIDLVHQNTGMNQVAMIASLLKGKPQLGHFRNFSPRYSRLVSLVAPRVNALVYITKAIEAHYTSLGLPSEHAVVIYDPIDSDSFNPTIDGSDLRAEFGLADGDTLISNIGRITPWKGQDYFLRAVIEMVEQVTAFKVLIVGKAGGGRHDHRFYEELQQLVEANGLNERVVFTGIRHDIPAIMAASDIVVHSAVQPEPFGRVIPEAMATGTAVVATNAGGVPEIVDDGVDGLLVPPNDASAMAAAMVWLIKNPDEARELGRRGRNKVIENFSIDRHVGAVEDLYRRILTP